MARKGIGSAVASPGGGHQNEDSMRGDTSRCCTYLVVGYTDWFGEGRDRCAC